MNTTNFPIRKTIKWKTILALVLIFIGSIMGWSWVWGVLFLFWAGTDIIYQETHLIEQITRSENPILYWIVVVNWIVLSLFSFIPYTG